MIGTPHCVLILSFNADAKDRPNLKIFHKDNAY